VSIVHCPPSARHLVERRATQGRVSACEPRLVRSNEVYHVDARLKVPVCRHILVVGGGRNIVSEAQTMIILTKVHVEQTLIRTIKGDAPLGHGHHGIEVAHVGCQEHDTCVEQVGPSNVRRSGEAVGKGKELIGSSIRDHIRINVDNLGELGLFPKIDLGKGGMQVGSIHELEVRGPLVANARYRDDIVVDGPELCDGLGRDRIEGDENGEALGGARIAKRVGENKSTWQVGIAQQKRRVNVLPAWSSSSHCAAFAVALGARARNQ
jgi:hypothetical protein